ncbi:ribosomal protein L7/L12 [Clostridium sp. SHJSY1]|uniref:ribosomal protein L7/L12 n=1 Tax=Clostridium sp. SHJSY1 TaxID=2942483 RepID=UPI00287542B6|nr:ribosomal protein L7/L12 [Clostridium sp. SHJSY1]MDS0525915.1 ribosomal protein L7/L12 [Clostridium sp. SHJSY1]
MESNIIWIIFCLGALMSISSSIGKLSNEIKRTNSILEKIAKQVGVPEPKVDDEIKDLVSRGKKIPAIKKYREISGVGLKEAKDYVDKLM